MTSALFLFIMAVMSTQLVNNDLWRTNNVMTLLGSFWNQVYTGKQLVEDYLAGRLLTEKQTFRDMVELVASVSRFTVPLYHKQNWTLLTLTESDLGQGVYSVFGDDHTFGYSINFGETTGTQVTYALTNPPAKVKALTTRITGSTAVLLENVDFVYTANEGLLIFNQNPFDNPAIPKIDIIDSTGLTIDRTIDLWAFGAEYDWKHVFTHFGYVVDLNLPTGQTYKNLVNAVFDCLVGGTTEQRLRFLVSALVDVPMIINPVETVEVIDRDSRGVYVVTDLEVYRINSNAILTVTVGDVLHAGDWLTDTLKLIDLSHGTYSGLSSLTLDASYFLGGTYRGGLTFNNGAVATTVTEDVDGKTKIEWPLGGSSADVNLFWTVCHARGVASGTTLANLLDERTDPDGEPVAENLPATIRPLQFLVENVLRHNALVLKAKSAGYGPNSIGLTDQTKLIRKVLPAHQTLIIQET